MHITISKALENELSELRELAIVTFQNTYEAYNTPENMKSYIETHFNKNRLHDELFNDDIHYYLLRADHDLAGYIRLNTGPEQTESRFPNSLEIERIYVAKAHHGKGLGHALLKKAIEIGKELGLAYIWLGVWDQNTKAIQFYERNGFYTDGIHPFMLGDEPQRDYVMKLDLNSNY
ncbi:MAG: GNAT family N-acetyltransferase [Aureisphaera sp.]